MKKPLQTSLLESRAKIQKLFQEEQSVSQTFKLSNFYSNHRLNINELKNRLEQFKRNHNTLLPIPSKEDPIPKEADSQGTQSLALKFKNTMVGYSPLQKQKITLPAANRNRLSHYQDGGGFGEAYSNTMTPESDTFGKEKVEQMRQANIRIVKEVKRYEGKIRTATGVRQRIILYPKSNHSQHQRKQSMHEKSKGQNLDSSKCSNSSNKQSNVTFAWPLEGRLVIASKAELVEFQKQVNALWSHYQLLTKILVSLREGTKNEKNAIVKYVEDICTDKFQFLKDLLGSITREGAQRNEFLFVKRLRRSIILSRLLQNMAVVYVGLAICQQREPEAHLVNFVGYCCSNVTFVIRFIYLLHSIDSELRLSAPVGHIMSVISQFQEDSYKQCLTRISDVVLRMQHNNQIIGIVQSRLCNSMEKQFQKIIVTFLKNVDLQSKSLYEYSHYIYEFLAFHLAKKNVVGQFSFLEMAPSPYISDLPKQKTLVIEPWEVLLALKGSTTYIRAYTDTFIREIGKYWNIVYWTDLMPQTIDALIDKLPAGKVLYRFHCRYENDRYLKLLWRLGCDTDNTIIVDREEANFKYDKQMGIALPWTGRKKDNKLLQLLGQLHSYLQQDTSLRKVFPIVKQNLQGFKKQSRGNRRSQSKEEGESFLPRTVARPRKGSRLQNYQQ